MTATLKTKTKTKKMALEISEIGIRLVVGEAARTPPPQQQPAPGQATLTPQQIEALVENCTQRVLQALSMLGER